jgi:UDP-3-O-[3-hydroxymyristoyl] glucosamine N-acyltransferase
MKLCEIAELLGCKGIEDSIEIRGMNTLRDASVGEISFLSDSKYEKEISETRVSGLFFLHPKPIFFLQGRCWNQMVYMSVALCQNILQPVRSSDTPGYRRGSFVSDRLY